MVISITLVVIEMALVNHELGFCEIAKRNPHLKYRNAESLKVFKIKQKTTWQPGILIELSCSD